MTTLQRRAPQSMPINLPNVQQRALEPALQQVRVLELALPRALAPLRGRAQERAQGRGREQAQVPAQVRHLQLGPRAPHSMLY